MSATRSSDTDGSSSQHPDELETPKKRPPRNSNRKRQRISTDDDDIDDADDISNGSNDGLTWTMPQLLDDDDVDLEIAVHVHKRISRCVQEIKMLSERSVKQIIKKVVLNDHVLAMVKLQEEEEEAKATHPNELPPKLTRSKAKELNKEVLPIPLNIGALDTSETSRLIAQELNSESEDEEYNPDNDDAHHSDDELNATLSDLDSQPRTPATPIKIEKVEGDAHSQIVDGVFKVPRARCDSTPAQLEQEIIAQRTRSKLSLHKTPIETIESTFIPPDITKDMYEFDVDMDNTWKEFLDEFMRPLNPVPENEDDETDPEYSAVDRMPSRLEFDTEGDIPLRELNDLVAELLGDFMSNEEDDALNPSQKTYTTLESTSQFLNSHHQNYTESFSQPQEDDSYRLSDLLILNAPTQELPISPQPLPAVPQEDVKWIEDLKHQVQIHMQLTCQSFLQTYSHPVHWQQADTYEGFVAELSTSHTAGPLTHGASKLVSHWKKTVDCNPTYMKSLQEQCDRQRLIRTMRKACRMPLHISVMDCILTDGDVFRCCDLLPLLPIHAETMVSRSVMRSIIPAEDALIARYLEKLKYNLLYWNKNSIHKKIKEKCLRYFCDEISRRFMNFRDGRHIYRHILRTKLEVGNPIQYFFETGKCPPPSNFVRELNMNNTEPIFTRIQDIPKTMKHWINRAKELSGPNRDSWKSFYKGISKRKSHNEKVQITEEPVLKVYHTVEENKVAKISVAWNLNNIEDTKSDIKLISKIEPIPQIVWEEVAIPSEVPADKKTEICPPSPIELPKPVTTSTPISVRRKSVKLCYKEARQDFRPQLKAIAFNLKSILANYRRRHKTTVYSVECIDTVVHHINAFAWYSELLKDLSKMTTQASGKRGGSGRSAEEFSKRMREMSGGGVSLFVGGGGEEAAKRGTKTSLRTNEQIKMLLSPETAEEIAERDAAFAQSYIEKVIEVLQAEGKDSKVEEFIDALQEYSVTTVNVPNLYSRMESILLPDHSELLETFLMFLLPGQAAQVGKFFEHFILTNMSTFLSKLNVFFSKYPTQIRKIHSSLNELSSMPNVTMETIKLKILPLLKGNQLLIDWFLQCFEGERPFQNPTIATDVEKINLLRTSDQLDSLDVAEQIPIRLIETDPNATSCPIRYMAGRIYCGSQIIIPAKLTFVAMNALEQYQTIEEQESSNLHQSPTSCPIHKSFDANTTPPDLSQTICGEDELQMHANRLKPPPRIDSCDVAPGSPRKAVTTNKSTAATVSIISKANKKAASPKKSPKSPLGNRSSAVASTVASPILEKAKKLKCMTETDDEIKKLKKCAVPKKDVLTKKSVDLIKCDSIGKDDCKRIVEQPIASGSVSPPVKEDAAHQKKAVCAKKEVSAKKSIDLDKCDVVDGGSDVQTTTPESVLPIITDQINLDNTDVDLITTDNVPEESDVDASTSKIDVVDSKESNVVAEGWTWQEDEQILVEVKKNELASEAELLDRLKSGLLVNRREDEILERFRFLMDVLKKLQTQ